MDTQTVDGFREWFLGYAGSFAATGTPEDRENMCLKIDHTLNVARDISRIAEGLGMSEDLICLADAVGLFHDIGRFPQYARYRTFRDSVSVNHGLLGATVLGEEGILDALPDREKDIIVQAVKFHNAFSMPDLRDDSQLHFIRLIRDADKMDIWRLFAEYYDLPAAERSPAVTLGLPELAGYSEEVLACIFGGRIAALSMLRSVNDFRLMKLSWIYDINFGPTFAMLKERGYIQRIAAKLPQTRDIARASGILDEYIDRKCVAAAQ